MSRNTRLPRHRIGRERCADESPRVTQTHHPRISLRRAAHGRVASSRDRPAPRAVARCLVSQRQASTVCTRSASCRHPSCSFWDCSFHGARIPGKRPLQCGNHTLLGTRIAKALCNSMTRLLLRGDHLQLETICCVRSVASPIDRLHGSTSPACSAIAILIRAPARPFRSSAAMRSTLLSVSARDARAAARVSAAVATSQQPGDVAIRHLVDLAQLFLQVAKPVRRCTREAVERRCQRERRL